MGGRGGASRSGGGGSARYNEQLARAEDSIRRDRVETAIVLDLDGNIVLQKSDGQEASVYFTKEEAALMQDMTFTHNHPGKSTLSEEDIGFADQVGMKEIRVCYDGGGYSLTREFEIGGQAPANHSKLSSDYAANVKGYISNVTDKVWNNSGQTQADADRCNKMVADYRRQWLTQNASSYGYTYKEF